MENAIAPPRKSDHPVEQDDASPFILAPQYMARKKCRNKLLKSR
jgi:hypothetical protein